LSTYTDDVEALSVGEAEAVALPVDTGGQVGRVVAEEEVEHGAPSRVAHTWTEQTHTSGTSHRSAGTITW